MAASAGLLDEIRRLFDEGHHPEALALVDDYLAVYTDGMEAQLLKAELCLTMKQNYAYVGAFLQSPPTRIGDDARVQTLRAKAEAVVREELAQGRERLREGSVKPSLECFERALQLAPTDGAVALAAALALQNREQPSNRLLRDLHAVVDNLIPVTERYLVLAVERSVPGSITYRRAVEHLLRFWQDQRKLAEAIGWLAAHSSDGITDLAAQVTDYVALRLYETILQLMRIRELALAESLLHTVAPAVEGCAILWLLWGEMAALRGRKRRAKAAYRKALRSTALTVHLLPPLLAGLQQSASLTRTCGQCGKATAALTLACEFCGLEAVDHLTLRTRFGLTTAPDVALAHVALAELLLDEGQEGQARSHLEAAQALLESPPAELDVLWARLRTSETRATPADSLLDAVESAMNRGITPDLHALIRHTCAEMPECWQRIPLRRRLWLARQVLLSDLELAQMLLHCAFVDKASLRSVRTLAAQVAAVVEHYRAALIADASSALQQGHADRALVLVAHGLRLQPDSSPLHLLRGKAHLQLGQDLPALEAFRAVAPDAACAADARLAAAEVLERRGEWTAALTMLESIQTDAAGAVYARLQRRQRGEPAVLVRHSESLVMHDTLERVHGSPHEQGFFAAAVRAVGRPWNDNGWVERILTAGYDLVQTLGGLQNVTGDPIFALRFIAHPHANIAERGQLTLALLVRVTADDRATCRALALDLWHTLHDVLPLVQDHVYLFDPVVDEDELQRMLTPFEPGYIAEIVRREDVPQTRGDRYAIYPFTGGAVDLHSLCWALLRQKMPSAVSIQLLPTMLLSWERATLDREMMHQHEPDAVEEPDLVRTVDPVSQWWQGAPRWGQAQANRSLVDSLRAQAYLLRVSVAGSAGANTLLPERVASTLFGPLRQGQGTLYGGYEIVRAGRGDEFEVAWRNFTDVDVERWVYSAAPNQAARLRHLVSEMEAATVFRLPVPGQTGVPGMKLVDARLVPPPLGMPAQGTLFGESVASFGGRPLPITQSSEDRRRHTYIVGKTGVGKSTLLHNLALQDIEAGHGVCVVDPHGELIDDLLAHIPPERMDDVVVFDPADDERPVGLNLLEWRTETEKHQIVNEFIGMLVRLYDPNQMGIVGPRFQHNVRNAMLTVMAVEGSTLIEVVRALSDSKYVQSILPNVTDPMVRLYWEKQIASTSDFHKSEVLDYIVSKFSKFVGEVRVRNIVGQRRTTLDFRTIMDRRQILLVKLSKGLIGPENAQFLGLLLVQRLLLTALSRADIPASQRTDFYLYMDEFQNFATEMFSTILSEGRKYGVAATVANQYLTQLDSRMREAIFGNVGTIISFRLGTQDASTLAPELYPVFSVDDLLNLPRYTACVKLLVNGLAERPFTMRTLLDLRPADAVRAAAVRRASRQKYGRDAAEVTQEILQRMALQ